MGGGGGKVRGNDYDTNYRTFPTYIMSAWLHCNYVHNKCLFRLYCGVFTVLQKIRQRQLPVKIRYREDVFTVWKLNE